MEEEVDLEQEGLEVEEDPAVALVAESAEEQTWNCRKCCFLVYLTLWLEMVVYDS